MKSTAAEAVEIQGPAIITADHAQTRHISTRAGAKQGWERLTVYEKEFRLGHLCCKAAAAKHGIKEEVRRANARRDAAFAFDEGWRIINASWPAGFDPNRVRAAGISGSFVDVERATKQFWRRVELAMGTNDWMICRRVCGEGYKVAETVVSIQPGYRDSTLARFREALDSLIEAIAKARGA
jgi:hypothetical protein